jgi:hypothetical protein
MGSSPLWSASDFNGLAFGGPPVSRLCPVQLPRVAINFSHAVFAKSSTWPQTYQGIGKRHALESRLVGQRGASAKRNVSSLRVPFERQRV